MSKSLPTVRRSLSGLSTVLCLLLAAVPFSFTEQALADGTETLGPPSIAIASGTGTAAKGVGLSGVTSGSIVLDVPAGVTVKQVLLYWAGLHNPATSGDNTIVVATTEGPVTVTGQLIGGPAFFFGALGGNSSSSYRADVTGLGLISPGTNTVDVSGLEFDRENAGAALYVIYDDGGTPALIDIRDGDDNAFYLFPEPRRSTVPQVFTFAASPVDRVSQLTLFAGSVEVNRPNAIRIIIDGVEQIITAINGDPYPFGDTDGDEWDTRIMDVTIPAGATSMSVEAVSYDDETTLNPASMVWIGANLTVPLAAALGDRVWDDTNNNGIQDPGEPGVDGVTVNLTDCAGTVLDSQMTAGGGFYGFTGLLPGTYCVAFEAPTGYVFTTPGLGGDPELDSDAGVTGETDPVTLAPGETNNSIDAGVVLDIVPGSIGDFVWCDEDNEGDQDSSEPGIEGVLVTLTCDNGYNETRTTDANGGYLFADVPPGNCDAVVDETSTPALDDKVPGDFCPLAIPHTLLEREEYLEADFCFVPKPDLGDFVWNDENRDGIQDPGEGGVEGVLVELFTCGDVFVDSQITSVAGAYRFENLDPGCYYVVFSDLPTGYQFSPDLQGGDTEKDSNAAPTTGRTPDVTLLAGMDDLSVDAGVNEKLGTIGDFVWCDENNDGIQDSSEPAIEGVLVELSCPFYSDSATTDANGEYLFENVPAGLCSVTADETSTPALDDKVPGDNCPLTISKDLAPGEEYLEADFCFVTKPDLGDFVWNDLNRDGIQDAGEPGIEGIKVDLFACDGTFVDTQTTSVAGAYLFENLDPGCYYVVFSDLPTGFQFSDADQGGDDEKDSDADPTTGRTPDVILVAGVDDLSIDAGLNEPAASLGDFVWDDQNRDGIQDSGEPGIDGVTVTLTDCRTTSLATTTTAGGGFYNFSGLDPGTYCVVFSDLPSGFEFSPMDQGGDEAKDSDADPTTGETDPITLAPGEVNRDVDAGLNEPTASLGDFVWNDLNRDGIQDSGEPGIDGVTVTLTDCRGTDLASTTTAGGGFYSFLDLDSGAYCVVFSDVPAGFEFSPQDQGGDEAKDSDADPTTGETDPITLAPGEVNRDVDAGFNEPTAALGDFVWSDDNRDGIQDGTEPGIDGVTVTLTDCRATDLASTTTAGGGLYSFLDLDPGTYCVVFSDLPAGYEFSPQDQGGDEAKDSDADPTTGATDPITLAPGEVNRDVDAGINQPTAALGDFVWNDLNRDGIQDDGEPGVDGVTATLTDCRGTDLATVATSGGGFYGFLNLDPGTYCVVFSDLPADFVFSPQDQGSDEAKDSDADLTTGETAPVTLVAGEVNRTVDAGINLPPAALGDRVWNDVNRDGIQDLGEVGVDGVTVTLTNCRTTSLATTTTAGGGLYAFLDLDPGTYCVVFSDLPADFVFSPQDQGGDEAKDSDADPTTGATAPVTLGPGEVNADVDAGINQPTAALGDRVWNDVNRDGIQDGAEPGVDGVTVTLTDCSGAELATTSTAGGGIYGFADLEPGAYCVVFSDLPADFVFSPQDQGGDEAKDSDADPTTGATAGVTLAPGEVNNDVDAGINQPVAALGDFVWNDLNADGIQDDGEPGVDGVTATLTDCRGNDLATTTTSGGGFYGFLGLDPGTYCVVFSDLPAGFEFSPKDQGGDDAKDSDADTTTGATEPVALAPGEVNRTVDAGINKPVAALGDRVWNDLNQDGIQDDGEPGIDGVTVTLTDCRGNDLATTATSGGGVYGFLDLTPGTYCVVFSDLPTGYAFTLQDQGGDDAVDSDADATTGATAPVTLAAGDVNRTVDAGAFEAFFECNECDGKVTQLTLRYNGPAPAQIKVVQKEGGFTAFEGFVAPGGDFTFSVAGGEDTFGTEIRVFVDGTLSVKIHTSCSKPIGPGLQVGAFEVLDGYSRDGGRLCPLECMECDGGVTNITLQYLGVAPGDVVVKDGDETYFDGTVPADGVFSFWGTKDDGKFEDNEINVFVNDNLDTSIHVSCSQPFAPGLTFGSFIVVEGSSKKGGPICEWPDCFECDGGVIEMTLQYDGAAPASIVVEDEDDTYYDAIVNPGASFTINGTKSDGKFQKNDVSFLVDGVLNTEIHMSCSQDVNPGLVYGLFTIVETISRDGGKVCPLPDARVDAELPLLNEMRTPAEIPTELRLEAAYPNPFNPTTTIRFGVPESGLVRLVVFDVLGREVRVLADGSFEAGLHDVRFESGHLPSGLYLYRIETANGILSGRMVLLK